MKAAVLFGAILAAFVVGGPTPLQGNGPRLFAEESQITVPTWIGRSLSPYLTSVQYSGEPGNESQAGSLLFQLPSDGHQQVSGLTARFAAMGFLVEDRTTSLDNFAGAEQVISATDPVSGRRVVISNTPNLQGALLRLHFEDPSV
jgi:hypothetical protein